ncbi:AAA family ATPase [Cordyceps javanica]|uniref:AAA family ATPase n=1 Tax=Cordyceps javanica TaxID=43265 RepID=A0A545VXU9_9HYPO|nr:AAA family ATPase [Cordyceps javanica]TQW06549.1 AAA family ATPase [Cordyceps javanica]
MAALEEKLGRLQTEYQRLDESMAAGASPNAADRRTSVGGGVKEEQTIELPTRALIINNKEDKDTDGWRDFLPDGTKLSSEQLEWARRNSAFTLRRIFRTWHDIEMEINNPELRNLLRHQLQRYPGHVLVGDGVVIVSPFEAIVFHWDILQEAAKKALTEKPDDQVHLDLKLLLDTISENSGDRRLDEYFKNRSHNMEQERITFETLWTIFPPGEKILGRLFQKQNQVLVVQDNLQPWPASSERGKERPWMINCWMYCWNGEAFRRTLMTLGIDHFDGSRPIVSLPFYPLRYHEDATGVETALEQRGREYKKMCVAKRGEQMFYYKGQAMLSKRGVRSSDELENSVRIGRRAYHISTLWPTPARSGFCDFLTGKYIFLRTKESPHSLCTFLKIWYPQVKGTVMIDSLSYNRYGPTVPSLGTWARTVDEMDCSCIECRRNEELSKMTRRHYDSANWTQSDDAWAAEQFVLCPPWVLGYVLREKQWAQLQVNLVHKRSDERNDAYFKKLKLSGRDSGIQTKQMLMNLVKHHATAGGKDDDQVDDIIQDKGKGLVILLYGPPGVGKTSTAETVALAAGKPLFPVSVADVGTKAKYVESNLETIFDLATAWEAILLIDEADVFLESRSQNMGNVTERNALVSVFLRVLEYYQGILFLTTNQIAQFDVAVQSRIHVALKYDALREEQIKDIFTQFLQQLRDKNKVEDMAGIENWIDSELHRRQVQFDGRQIRNIVSCAMNLARANGRKLAKEDLLTVADLVRSFKTEFQLQYDRYLRAQSGIDSVSYMGKP